ncbi:MAG: phosphoribosylglycinamide formyltransferase [Bacteroidales bacterium]|jgi:phosphoribosylglycinamide formyltransferase-1|nr:phosphoribosylglycinamide formyltransferase [Bacteroidales bacterium]
MKNIVLFASGNGTIVQNIVEYFGDKSKNICVRLIVCNNANAYVMTRAKNLNIDALHIDKKMIYENNTLIDILQKNKTDLIVLAGFLWLIPESMINAFPNKIINIHPALLPKYGGKGMYGMHVHQAVIANQEAYTGISIHYVNQHYDEGNIIFQEKCFISPADTAEDVAQKVHQLEYAHYPKIIEQLLQEIH